MDKKKMKLKEISIMSVAFGFSSAVCLLFFGNMFRNLSIPRTLFVIDSSFVFSGLLLYFVAWLREE